MRNIKITALLLAVLMIVAAFAGCGSDANVSELDNKVNDLDGKIQDQANALAGIQDSLKDLADAIGDNSGSTELDDIKADVEANKQSVADILAAIEGLKDAVAGATGDDEEVKAAIYKAGAKIDALKEDYAAEKKHYKAEDYAAIIETLGAAQASISTGVTVEAVASFVASMESELAKYVRVDDSIYAYVVALEGNITDASADLVKEAMDALTAAEKFYFKADGDYKALEEYEISEDEETNLRTDIADLNTAQTVTLPDLKDRAKGLVAAIDEAIAKFDKTTLDSLSRTYRTFVRDAEKLSEENVALVTNADKLNDAILSASNVNAALDDLKTGVDWEIISVIPGTNFGLDVKIFDDYLALVDDNKSQAVITFKTLNSKGKDVMANTIKIYDTIDAKLAEFAEEYELSETALEWVIAQYKDKYFLAKYEADKALLKAFMAEYDVLAEGVFADIKGLASTKLTATSAFDLVTKYEANEKAINDWKDGLEAAYAKAYDALEDINTVSYNKNDYKTLVEANFNAMAVASELGVWNLDTSVDPQKWVYAGYTDGFNATGANKNYFKLYAFNYADNAALGTFLDVTYTAAEEAAKNVNENIKAIVANQELSIVDSLVNVGGYVKAGTDDAGKPVLVAKNPETEPYVLGTIAHFIKNYKTDKYDLSGMIETALYEEKIATIEKNVTEAKAALDELMKAYNAIKGTKDAVVVTMNNVQAIKDLKALLDNVNKIAHVDMVIATLENTTAAGVKEYSLKSIVDEKDLNGKTTTEFYAEVLLANEFSTTDSTVTPVKDTGAITRLIYKATALEKEANVVISAYNAIKKVNSAFGGKAFAFATINEGHAIIAKLKGEGYSNLATYGYLYGATSAATTKVTVNNVDKYHASAKLITFRYGEGDFVEYELSTTNSSNGNWGFTGEPFATEAAARTALWNTIRNRMLPGVLDIADKDGFYNFMFEETAGSLKTLIKGTDSEALNSVLYDRFIPAFALPMIATYLEAKFVVNNMGETYQPIVDAKAGWGAPTSNYGFAYIKALVATMVNKDTAGKLNQSRLDAIGNAADYDLLTRAVLAADQDVKLTKSIKFGHADKTWLAKTYDIRVIDYNKGDAADATLDAKELEDYTKALDELEFDVITIYEVKTRV